MTLPVGPKNWHLPVEGHGGSWDGLAGFSRWHAQGPEVQAITGGQPVVFEGCYPDFSPWAQKTYVFDTLTGTGTDFTEADRRLAEEMNLPDRAAAAAYRTEAKLTWHHHQDGRSLLLVPRALHAAVPHAGGAQMLRALELSRSGGVLSSVARHTRLQERIRAGGELPPIEILSLTTPRLPRGNLDPENHTKLQNFLAELAQEKPAKSHIAVFDFDSTCTYGESGPMVWHFMLENLAVQVPPERLGDLLPMPQGVSRFANGLLPSLLRDDIAAAYGQLWPLKGNLNAARKLAAYRDFNAKVGVYCENYDRVNARFGEDGPLWMRWFAGFTPESLGNISVQAADTAGARKGLRQRQWVSQTAGKAGMVTYRFEDGFGPRSDIIHLQRALKKASASASEKEQLRICVVTGGVEPMVRALTMKYRFPVAPKDIIGTRYVLDGAGRLTSRILRTPQRPATYGPGKSTCIRNFFGQAPIFVAGDSDGDYNMLTDFPETKVRFIVDAQRQGKIASLYKSQENPLHVVQAAHPRSGQFTPAALFTREPLNARKAA